MLLSSLAVLLAGCMAHTRIVYLQPAEISLPPEVDVIAPVDRLSTPVSEVALQEFATTLSRSPRVKVVDRSVAQQAYASVPSLVGSTLAGDTLKDICTRTKATGVAVLEGLQPGEAWMIDRHPETRNEKVTVTDPATGQSVTSDVQRTVEMYRATVNVSMGSLWRTYDCSGQVIDQADIGSSDAASGEGLTDSEARANVPPIPALHNQAAGRTGAAYARRIAPYQVESLRTYYPKGSKDMKSARKAVDLQDWGKAQSLWESASASEKDKVKGKAFYNLAVAAEQSGHIKKAVNYAEKADNLLSNNKTSNYLAVLQQRQKDTNRLKEQMSE